MEHGETEVHRLARPVLTAGNMRLKHILEELHHPGTGLSRRGVIAQSRVWVVQNYNEKRLLVIISVTI